jgi:hypothetical protein
MANGMLVRATTVDEDGASIGSAHYAAACPSSGEAVEAVRGIIPVGSRVMGAIGAISVETIELLGLKPGEARRL